MITAFFLGLLVTNTLLLIWFYSPLRITLSHLFISKDINSYDEFETFMLFKFPIIGKLLSCFICCSFWTSFIVGCIFAILLSNVPVFFPVITALTYPGLCYMYKTFIEK